MSRKRTCAISSSISFLTSAGIPIYLDTFATEETLNNALARRDQTWLESSATVISLRLSPAVEQLAIFTFAFEIGNQRSKIGNCAVPVVQRKEQGFPKTKVAFHHTSSAVVSTTQTTLR